MNRLLRRTLIAMLLGVALLGAFAVYSGLNDVKRSLSHFAPLAFLLALTLSSVNYVLRFLKWEYYLRRLGIRGVPAFDSFLVFLSGFVLTVTPGKVGEVFKSAVLAKTHGVPMARTAPIVVADRLTDVIAVVTLVAVGGSALRGGAFVAGVGSLIVATVLLFVLWPAPAEALCRALERRPGRLARVAPRLREALGSLRIVASPAALFVPTALSVVAWGLEGCALYVLVRGFGESLDLGLAVFFYATSTLAGALSPLPGGLGLVEGALRGQLTELGGIEAGTATASMMLIRLATLWWAVAVGFLALFWLRLRFPEALKDADETGAADPRSA